MESTLSKREPRVKLWKGFQRGEVWGTLLGRYGTPQFSRGGVAGADAAPIAQTHCSPATGRLQAH